MIVLKIVEVFRSTLCANDAVYLMIVLVIIVYIDSIQAYMTMISVV
jgi:hypothetical protein